LSHSPPVKVLAQRAALGVGFCVKCISNLTDLPATTPIVAVEHEETQNPTIAAILPRMHD
jgi:hypothetical protein